MILLPQPPACGNCRPVPPQLACRHFCLLLALDLASPLLWVVSIFIFSSTSGDLPSPPDGFYPSLKAVVLGWGMAQWYWASLLCLWSPWFQSAAPQGERGFCSAEVYPRYGLQIGPWLSEVSSWHALGCLEERVDPAR